MSPSRIVYITKYALTTGILTGEVESADPDGYVWVHDANGLNGASGFCKNDWHWTLEQAEARVGEMIANAEKSAKKKEAKLFRLKAQLFNHELKITALARNGSR